MSNPETNDPLDKTPDPQVKYRRPLTLLPLLTIALFICIIIVAIIR